MPTVMDRAKRLLLRWRGAHRQECFGKREEARGVEPQEFVINGQPARRQNRRHPGQLKPQPAVDMMSTRNCI
jgi:hypothetical protein